MTGDSSDRQGHVRWRVHLRSGPEAVFLTLATSEGRARFWAESAVESHGVIHFTFSNGQQLESRVIASTPHECFRLTYFGGSTVTFELAPDGQGGTDLAMTETDVPDGELDQNRAGWVCVLMALKAAVDFGIDLRNHDPGRTWEHGYVDV